MIRSAKQRIVLFDNYVDDTTLALLDKRADGVEAVIYTKKVTSILSADVLKITKIKILVLYDNTPRKQQRSP